MLTRSLKQKTSKKNKESNTKSQTKSHTKSQASSKDVKTRSGGVTKFESIPCQTNCWASGSANDIVETMSKMNPLFLQQLQDEMKYITSEEQQNIQKQISKIPERLNSKQMELITLNQLMYQRYYSDEPPNDQKVLERLYAIGPNDEKFYFNKRLGTGQDQRVFLGTMFDKKGKKLKQYVAKWVPSYLGAEGIEHEMERWDLLKKTGAKLPEYFTGFTFWNTPIMIMQQLLPLDKFDNCYEVGLQVLDFLEKVHVLGVHNDLKPENIMKSYTDSKKIEYFVIDYGGFTMEKRHYGFKRKTWSTRWTYQTEASNQVTTPKYDLLELGGTMKGMQLLDPNVAEDISKYGNTNEAKETLLKNYVHTFYNQHPLIPFMEVLYAIPDDKITPKVYSQLRTILKTLKEMSSI